MSKLSKARWKVILNVVTFVAFAVLIFAIRRQIIESFQTIGHIRWWWLLFIPILQILNYDAYARQNKALFGILGSKISYRYLYKVNLELNFVNHVFPSGGVSGFSYFSLRLRKKGVSGTQASLVQLMRFVLVFVALLALLMLALVLLTFSGSVNRFVLLAGGSISTLIVVSAVAMAFIIGSERRIHAFFGFITKMINRLIHIVRPKHPETINMARAQEIFEDLHQNYAVIKNDYSALRGPLIWSLVANVTEILTIYVVYLAFGHLVNPGAIIIAYTIANIAGFLSVLPSGVGVYEALMTAVLAIGGISPAISIPVTVMYRVLSMIVQILPGYYLYHKQMRLKEV